MWLNGKKLKIKKQKLTITDELLCKLMHITKIEGTSILA